MRRENVFLVTLQSIAANNKSSSISNVVICAANADAMHEYVKNAFPNHVLIGAASMTELEMTLKSIRDSLDCKPGSYAVYVDPQMKTKATPAPN